MELPKDEIMSAFEIGTGGGRVNDGAGPDRRMGDMHGQGDDAGSLTRG